MRHLIFITCIGVGGDQNIDGINWGGLSTSYIECHGRWTKEEIKGKKRIIFTYVLPLINN